MKHTRWFCQSCYREWLYAHQWSQEQGCPACGSQQIRQVSYMPKFPGADIMSEGTSQLSILERPREIAQENPTLQLAEVDPYVAQLGALLGVEL